MISRSNSLIRYTLGTLLAFAALNAFGGGYYAMSGAQGVPLEWLQGSPFRNYFVPGLILFGVVGGAFLIASVAVFCNSRLAKRTTYISVLIVSVWLFMQIIIIGYVSWMQPTTAGFAIVILFLSIILDKQKKYERWSA